MLGCIPHGRRIAPGDTTARQRSENITHVGNTHTRGHTQLEAVRDKAATVFYETGEWAAKHHTCQIPSSLQRPGNQTQPDSPSLVCLRNMGFLIGHAYAHLFGFHFFYILEYYSISTDIMGMNQSSVSNSGYMQES